MVLQLSEEVQKVPITHKAALRRFVMEVRGMLIPWTPYVLLYSLLHLPLSLRNAWW